MDENEKEPPTENARFRFGVRTSLWVTAILSVGMALLGPCFGLCLGALVIAIHALWPTYQNAARFLLALLLFSILIVILLPWVRSSSPIAVRNQSSNQLKQSVLSLHNYHDTHGHFPPSFSTDDNGRPLHSWRTLTLPYIEENAVYDSIQRNEAWDSPANKLLLEGLDIPVLRSPRESYRNVSIGESHYLAIVDEETVWSPGQTVTLDDIPDGAANTIVLIEAIGQGIPWYEPRDLTLDQAIDLLTGTGETNEWIRPGYFVSDRLQGDGLDDRLVAYADAHVETVPTGSFDRETARAFLTRSGGENIEGLVDRTSPRKVKVIGHVVHWGRIGGMVVFIMLAVGPSLRDEKLPRQECPQ